MYDTCSVLEPFSLSNRLHKGRSIKYTPNGVKTDATARLLCKITTDYVMHAKVIYHKYGGKVDKKHTKRVLSLSSSSSSSSPPRCSRNDLHNEKYCEIVI